MSNKELSHLLNGFITDAIVDTLKNIDISNIQLDSRLLTTNGLFVALNGTQTDGRLYINKAIELGAVAALIDANDTNFDTCIYSIPVITIDELESKLSEIASRFYDYPQHELSLIGITGTNGKTTVNQLVGQWLTLLGKKTYCMGTLGNGLYGQLVDSPNTTLNAIDLISHLARARQLGASHVVMEVSSHGLSLGRVNALHFDVAAFTNLTQDHLDFHGTMQAYADAKHMLFTDAYSKTMVLNGVDNTAKGWIAQWQQQNRLVELSCFNESSALALNNVVAKNIAFDQQGFSASLSVNNSSFNLRTKLLGAFNVDNVLTAFSCLLNAGFSAQQLLEHVSKLTPVAGRMEVFGNENTPSVVVDYAHTPDALKQALSALRVHCSGQIWIVFGCGGDRDAKKRPLMAAIAEQYADRLVITQDNSRSESPSAIFADMLEGIDNKDLVTVEHDRTFAVKSTIERAKVGDIVLLAGKGHEDYQILQCGRVDYDERALAQNTVENLL